MPLVKLNLRRTHTANASEILAAVQSALVGTFGIPSEDLFQLVNRYDDSDFVHTPGYLGIEYSPDLVMIEITFVEGRSEEMKKALIAAICKNIVEATGMRSDDVFLMFTEVGRANVSFGRGIAQRAA